MTVRRARSGPAAAGWTPEDAKEVSTGGGGGGGIILSLGCGGLAVTASSHVRLVARLLRTRPHIACCVE